MILRLSRALRELHRLGQEAPAPTFQDEAFGAMKELIRFDFAYWGAGRGPMDAVVMHYSYLYRLPSEQVAMAFEKVKFHPKVVETITRLATHAGQAQIFDTRAYGATDFYGRFGIDQMVSMCMWDENLGLYHVLSLYRSGEERFTEQERLLFESAVPHLYDAWRESKLLHLSCATPETSHPSLAAALLDDEGSVHFARPAFVELMRSEWPDWHGPFVPDAMRCMKDGSFVGKEVAVRFIPQHDLYLTRVRRKGIVDLLSARELEVAKQLARGLNHKEIASRLAIAPATVRNHIANVHAKLDSHKVAQLATILMNAGMFN
jgi:DNA-binding CsgD family transcriptional regulator